MLYSVRMRAAQGAAHEDGGRHISGAERLVSQNQIGTITRDMLERAFNHTRGQAEYINISIEAVDRESVQQVPLLPVTMIAAKTITTSRAAARAKLISAGVTAQAVENGLKQLLELEDGMRGAMLICAETGKRCDTTGMRGIRVSRMDVSDEFAFKCWLEQQKLNNIHTQEAMVLAAKVASAPGIVAEICWSDDPEYTTGYVASAQGYFRITNLKPFGSSQGGRLFFVSAGSDLTILRTYLEKQPVLVTVPAGEAKQWISSQTV